MATETLLKADTVTLVLERLPEGKIRFRCSSWDDYKTLLKGQEIMIFSQHGQVHIMRVDRFGKVEPRELAGAEETRPSPVPVHIGKTQFTPRDEE